MTLDLSTSLVAAVVLCASLSATILIGLQGRVGDGALRRWVESLLILGSLALSGLFLSDKVPAWSLAAFHVGLALALSLQGDAVARLGGNGLPHWVVVLPPLALLLSLLSFPGADDSSRSLLYANVTGLQMLVAALLAPLPSREVSLRGRVSLFLPLLVGGLTQMGKGFDMMLASFQLNFGAELSAGMTPVYRLVLFACLAAATLAMVMIDLERADRAVRRHARRDPLTGLFNRRTWAEKALRELARAESEGLSFTVVVVAIERLRLIVRDEGRIAADRALINLARALVDESERQFVIGGRINGELLGLAWAGAHGPSPEQLEHLGLRAEAACEHELGLRLKVSQGVARARPGEPLNEVLARADRERRDAVRATGASAFAVSTVLGEAEAKPARVSRRRRDPAPAQPHDD